MARLQALWKIPLFLSRSTTRLRVFVRKISDATRTKENSFKEISFPFAGVQFGIRP